MGRRGAPKAGLKNSIRTRDSEQVVFMIATYRKFDETQSSGTRMVDDKVRDDRLSM